MVTGISLTIDSSDDTTDHALERTVASIGDTANRHIALAHPDAHRWELRISAR